MDIIARHTYASVMYSTVPMSTLSSLCYGNFRIDGTVSNAGRAVGGIGTGYLHSIIIHVGRGSRIKATIGTYIIKILTSKS